MSNKNKKNQKPYVIIISGPTASGKTDLSLQLSNFFEIEIINVDVGQFYKPLNIGTAKPDWKNQKITHHCFDLIDEPKDLSVFEFNKIIEDKINDIFKRDKIPVLVGGSLFYIKSLFFPPTDFSNSGDQTILPVPNIEKNVDTKVLWKKLNAIDPKRAKALHENDVYRIQRALEIWEKTGIKPSEYEPKFEPKFNARIIFIDLDKEKLIEKINKRTELMIESGWIEETKKIIGTDWQDFLRAKRLIGYPEIIQWIKKGANKKELKSLIESIQVKTRQYAKRQLTFWKGFRKSLEKHRKESNLLIEFLELKKTSKENILRVQENIQNDLDRLSD